MKIVFSVRAVNSENSGAVPDDQFSALPRTLRWKHRQTRRVKQCLLQRPETAQDPLEQFSRV